MADEPTRSTSESENPAIPAPEPATRTRPRRNKDWWPNQLDLSVLHQHLPGATPWARTSTTPRSSRRSTSTR